jgi:hypothetical protein
MFPFHIIKLERGFKARFAGRIENIQRLHPRSSFFPSRAFFLACSPRLAPSSTPLKLRLCQAAARYFSYETEAQRENDNEIVIDYSALP